MNTEEQTITPAPLTASPRPSREQRIVAAAEAWDAARLARQAVFDHMVAELRGRPELDHDTQDGMHACDTEGYDEDYDGACHACQVEGEIKDRYRATMAVHQREGVLALRRLRRAIRSPRAEVTQ